MISPEDNPEIDAKVDRSRLSGRYPCINSSHSMTTTFSPEFSLRGKVPMAKKKANGSDINKSALIR